MLHQRCVVLPVSALVEASCTLKGWVMLLPAGVWALPTDQPWPCIGWSPQTCPSRIQSAKGGGPASGCARVAYCASDSHLQKHHDARQELLL